MEGTKEGTKKDKEKGEGGKWFWVGVFVCVVCVLFCVCAVCVLCVFVC